MKKLISLLIVIFFFQSGFAQQIGLLESKIDEYVIPYLEMDAWSGVISIYQSGQPIIQRSYGYADREWETPNTAQTKFRIASISKVFTEVAILKLVENNQLSLEDKLTAFIPDYPRGNEISVRQLLTHRSGVPHLNSFPNYNELIKFDYRIEDVIDLFKNKPLEFEPGFRYRYSNSGYVLLAFIIEQLSGLTYESYLNEEIFKPLDLHDTGIDDETEIIENRAKGYMFNELGHLINAEYVNMDIKIGGGSLYSTSEDLNRFIQKLLNGEVLKSTLNELPNFGDIEGERLFTANGRVQGFCHQITHRINQDITVIILGNHYSNIALPIADDIYKIYSGESYEVPENYLSQEIKVSVEDLKDYAGTYDFGFGPVGEVKVIDDYLGYGAPGRNSFDKLIPIGGNKFFYIQSWVVLEFKNKENNIYETLDWIMGENRYPASRKN